MPSGVRAEAYERAFATRHYNAGIPRAALASPEFLLKMRL